ncbi:DUF3866 family protein [Nostocoides sp. F2B08]|uniref:DUF3866 family protein n=1 Tax=Nostocoides sp. F2B08 TaxID=2653936 RepID=UPI00351A4A48
MTTHIDLRGVQWRVGRVTARRRDWPGAIELSVEVEELRGPGSPAETVTALAYTGLHGEPEIGERVVLNVGALLRGLGTGGLAFVVTRETLPPDTAAPGHIVKARYTPLQQMLLAVDEQDSVHHAVLAAADDVGGMPVVVADLHSALPAVIAGVRREDPRLRVAYVMTDGGALPLAFSRTVAALRDAEWLVGSVTVGQAFGGDLEAVTVHTGLLAARHVLDADVTVVIQGPGNVGTGTRWGYSGVAAGEAVNAVAVLSGRPVAALRVSDADPRPRHRGISHHSTTAYGTVALRPADLPVPDDRPDLIEAAHRLAAESRAPHRVVRVATDGLEATLRSSPVRLSTMGRGYDEDPAAFLSAAAAGRHAARLTAEVDARPAGPSV